jgi:hypothetical protein
MSTSPSRWLPPSEWGPVKPSSGNCSTAANSTWSASIRPNPQRKSALLSLGGLNRSGGFAAESLGFLISSRTCRIRPKSVKKFQDKVRKLTVRKFNFEAELIVKLNRVIRGTAQYFAVPAFVTGRNHLRLLDSWIRMRLRALKFKRKSRRDNRRMRVKSFHKLGLLSLESFFAASV